MSNSKNRKKSNYDVDSNTIITFCKKNVKYISAGILTVALILVLVMTVGDSKSGEGTDAPDKESLEQGGAQGQQEAAGDEGDAAPEEEDREYEVDLPEVKELVSTYYNSYAAGDVEKLESITESLSDMEKSYIKMMNNYVANYNNVTCYTKEGQEEGSYLASATFSMKFHDVEGGLPGMDFFYIKTDDKGKLYIDSLYCPFNRQMDEQETDPGIDKLIEDFGEIADISKLQQDCQSEYDQMVGSDEQLKKMADTMKEAIKEWKDSYDPEAEKAEAEAKEKKKKKEEKKKKKEEERKKKEEEKKKKEQQEEEAANQQEEAPEEGDSEAAPEEDTEGQQPEAGPEENTEDNSSSSGLNYVPEGTVLTANDGYNVRVSMNESAELIGTTAIGDNITVILSYAEGWTKVEWNGQTGYIRTDLLLNN